MVAQKNRPTRTISTRKPSKTQQDILKVKMEHPDLSTRQIATLAKCDHSNVVRCLQRYNTDHSTIIDYKDNRPDIFAGLQHRLIYSITDADIQKTPVGSRILAACQIYDKERLERGQSTSHTITLHADLADVKAMRSKRSKNIDDLDD